MITPPPRHRHSRNWRRLHHHQRNPDLGCRKPPAPKTFAVTINADDIDEPNETFTIILSGVENATLSDGEATITIADDNDAPRITIGDVTVSEGGGRSPFPSP
ncbi:MAG: hypothetical protein M5U34_04895 [Chloroflexi bacterium]|nr:hypothetical protein [Chloroflexota bacterium]